MFFIIPLIFLGLSFMYEQKKSGLTVLASFIVVAIGVACIYLGYWCRWKGGQEKCRECFAARERKRVMMRELPDDMDYLKSKVSALIEYTGLPVDDDDDEVSDAVKDAKTDEDKTEHMKGSDESVESSEIDV